MGEFDGYKITESISNAASAFLAPEFAIAKPAEEMAPAKPNC